MLSRYIFAVLLVSSSGSSTDLQPYDLMPRNFTSWSNPPTNELDPDQLSSTDQNITLYSDTLCSKPIQVLELNYTRLMQTAWSEFRSISLARPVRPGEYINFAMEGEVTGMFFGENAMNNSSPPPNENGALIGTYTWACASRVASFTFADQLNHLNSTCIQPTANASALKCVGSFLVDLSPMPLNLPYLMYNCTDPSCANIELIYQP